MDGQRFLGDAHLVALYPSREDKDLSNGPSICIHKDLF